MATTTRTRRMSGSTSVSNRRTRIPLSRRVAAMYGTLRSSLPEIAGTPRFRRELLGVRPGPLGPVERLCHRARRGRGPARCVVGQQPRSLPWPRRIPRPGAHCASGAAGIRRATREGARGPSLSRWVCLRRCRRGSAPARCPLRRGTRGRCAGERGRYACLSHPGTVRRRTCSLCRRSAGDLLARRQRLSDIL